MEKVFLCVLLLSLLSCSGCVLGVAALIRWDQRRYNAQQEKLCEERERSESGSDGSGSETDGAEDLHEVPGSSSGDEKEVEVPVQPFMVEDGK